MHHRNILRFAATLAMLAAFIATNVTHATHTDDAHPAPDATVAHSGEDRWCTIPLDGTETIVQWSQWSDGGRSEVSTTTPNARCAAPLAP